MNLIESAREFFAMLWRVLPRALWVEALAWLVTFAFLVVTFKTLKSQLKPGLMKLDDGVRAWAKTLRYRAAHPNASLAQAQRAGQLELAAARTDTTPEAVPEAMGALLDADLDDNIEARAIARELDDDSADERVPLTYFFRFWTNFASAPSLCFFSLGVPVWMYHRAVNSTVAPPLHDASWIFAQMAIWLVPGLCYAGSMLLSFVLKRVFKRLRPQRKMGDFGHKLKDGSFPSGHSLTSFCFWMAMIWTVAAVGTATPGLLAFGLAATSIVALTGLSRVYLGVHFPTDVLGGFTIGAAWCAACAVALPIALNWSKK